ncbi:hypothetical protein EVAR_48831_1 [Eumeta japonica]|uniref:Uncharacterized protein n=1 Tax=Eumeta variegata TaxID=151549 RepID=A0A4C1YEG4_EUMVA|nr:hypothetical protein EVAR_48831_1 [Eumeta japonica]
MERSILDLKLKDKHRSSDIRHKTKPIKHAQQLKWKWAGHMIRTTGERWNWSQHGKVQRATATVQPQGTWSNLGCISGLTPVSLWALLEWTFISPVLVGSKMKKYFTQEEDESGTSGQTAHQTSRNRSAETEKLMKVLSVSKEERISGKGRNALKAALESGLEFTKEQAMDILGKLIKDLRGFADPK